MSDNDKSLLSKFKDFMTNPDNYQSLLFKKKEQPIDADLVLLQEGKLPVIPNSPVALKKDEHCHYSNLITLYIPKTKVTGYSGASSSVSVRVAKGVTYRTGGSKGAPIRENVMEPHKGVLSITSKRIIFTSMQNGFDKKISAISSILPADDGLVLQFSSNTYAVEAKDAKKIIQILNIIMNQQTD